MDNIEETSISGLISRIAQKSRTPVMIETGQVIDTDPLKIALKNDPSVILGTVDLVVPESMRRKTVTVAGVTVTIQKALAVGDEVFMLAYANGKKFLVLDRV